MYVKSKQVTPKIFENLDALSQNHSLPNVVNKEAVLLCADWMMNGTKCILLSMADGNYFAVSALGDVYIGDHKPSAATFYGIGSTDETYNVQYGVIGYWKFRQKFKRAYNTIYRNWLEVESAKNEKIVMNSLETLM